MSDGRKRQEEERRKKTEERIARQHEKDILEKTKKERRQKELAKKLKGQHHVSMEWWCFGLNLLFCSSLLLRISSDVIFSLVFPPSVFVCLPLSPSLSLSPHARTQQPIPRQTEKTKFAQDKVKETLKKRADDAAKKIQENNKRLERVRG